MNEVENYRYQKLLNLIIFDSDPDYTDGEWLYGINVLETLKEVIKVYVDQCYLGDIARDNIFKFLINAREIKDENYVKRIYLINEIIKLVNSQRQDDSIIFYRDDSIIFYRIELYKRTKKFRYLFKASNEEIMNNIQVINNSICNDYVVLISHNSEVDDKTFIKEYLEDLSTNELYYESINTFIDECPQVFKDLTFYNRVILTLESNVELNNNDITLVERNNRIVKKMNRKKTK